jgi:hypothetical protein
LSRPASDLPGNRGSHDRVVAALDAEAVEADGAAGDAEQIRGQQRQRGSVLVDPTMLGGDLAGVIEPFSDVRSIVGRSSVPVSVIVTLPLHQGWFRRDVEFRMDVTAIGERNVAARDAEGRPRR